LSVPWNIAAKDAGRLSVYTARLSVYTASLFDLVKSPQGGAAANEELAMSNGKMFGRESLPKGERCWWLKEFWREMRANAARALQSDGETSIFSLLIAI
jgi:hypothetical protein